MSRIEEINESLHSKRVSNNREDPKLLQTLEELRVYQNIIINDDLLEEYIDEYNYILDNCVVFNHIYIVCEYEFKYVPRMLGFEWDPKLKHWYIPVKYFNFYLFARSKKVYPGYHTILSRHMSFCIYYLNKGEAEILKKKIKSFHPGYMEDREKAAILRIENIRKGNYKKPEIKKPEIKKPEIKKSEIKKPEIKKYSKIDYENNKKENNKKPKIKKYYKIDYENIEFLDN